MLDLNFIVSTVFLHTFSMDMTTFLLKSRGRVYLTALMPLDWGTGTLDSTNHNSHGIIEAAIDDVGMAAIYPHEATVFNYRIS